MSHAQAIVQSTQSQGLPEVLERVLDKGVVIMGDIKIKLCDVELLSIQIRLLVCSVDKAREMGVAWWEPAVKQDQAVPMPHYRQSSTPLPESTGEPMRAEESRFQQAMRAVENGPAEAASSGRG
jgi:hypothetical protein